MNKKVTEEPGRFTHSKSHMEQLEEKKNPVRWADREGQENRGEPRYNRLTRAERVWGGSDSGVGKDRSEQLSVEEYVSNQKLESKSDIFGS